MEKRTASYKFSTDLHKLIMTYVKAPHTHILKEIAILLHPQTPITLNSHVLKENALK